MTHRGAAFMYASIGILSSSPLKLIHGMGHEVAL